MTTGYLGDLLFQIGTSPAEDAVPDPVYAATVVDGMLIERNVAITLTDGTIIYVDVFRPDGAVDVPPLIAWGPYGKHNGGAVYQQFKDESGNTGGGVEPEWLSDYTTFEGPDPKRWCANGYAVINVDPRATWWSEGDYATFWDEREAHDTVDVIAWAGTQPWSNGKVGMSGVSYLAVAQWWAASLQPPYLAAINPCEGLTDVYREFAFHGGIPSNFPKFWQQVRLKYSTSKVEAIADMMGEHNLDDEYWATKRPDLANITVPTYVIASWSDQGLHTRGTLAGFEQISSPHKYLEVHGRKKWEYYHRPATVDRQRQFFDRYLKGIDNDVENWPRIRLETRWASYQGTVRTPSVWPPAETTFRNLFLDAAQHALSIDMPSAASSARYVVGDHNGGLSDEVELRPHVHRAHRHRRRNATPALGAKRTGPTTWTSMSRSRSSVPMATRSIFRSPTCSNTGRWRLVGSGSRTVNSIPNARRSIGPGTPTPASSCSVVVRLSPSMWRSGPLQRTSRPAKACE